MVRYDTPGGLGNLKNLEKIGTLDNLGGLWGLGNLDNLGIISNLGKIDKLSKLGRGSFSGKEDKINSTLRIFPRGTEFLNRITHTTLNRFFQGC